jgi:hypothetical protein
MNSPVLAFSGLLHELKQQVTDLLRLFLLHPMAGAFDEMTTDHARARDCLHRFVDARTLIGAPILFAGNEAGRHVDCAAGMSL